ncbi:MAG: hypothetical protein R3B47_18525 [Bacteroidia bacterium]
MIESIHFDALGRLSDDALGSLLPEFDHGHLLEKKWDEQQQAKSWKATTARIV